MKLASEIRLALSCMFAAAAVALALSYPAAADTRSCDQACQNDEHLAVQQCTTERTACQAACNGNGPCIQQCGNDFIVCKEDAYDTYTECVANCS